MADNGNLRKEKMAKRYELKLGSEPIVVETGKLAKQANGSCTVQMGGTVVLVSAVSSKEPRPGANWFPLFVEYQEKTYAAGKIPGGFFKREGRPSEKEILTARLIDRPIRPLFPKGYLNEVQVMAMVLSSDGQNDSDILALIGASCALSISSIPFDGPIGGVRIGRINNEFVVNPTFTELEDSEFDLIVTGTRDGVVMLEGKAGEVSEELIHEAIEFGYDKAKEVISFAQNMAKECGRTKDVPVLKETDPKLIEQVNKLAASELEKINNYEMKEERSEASAALIKGIISKLVTEGGPYTDGDVKDAMEEIEKEIVRQTILKKGKRADGRKFTDLRNISCEAGVLPRTHGSGLFTRGQTQSLATTTLGTSADEQMIDGLREKVYNNFMLHYNFPPFSVGEVKPVRGPGRREIGHGALAHRALKAVMPSKDDFPYTVRLVSDILESNGSSSMATVCAGTISLMDAGVPIKSPVTGVALGLVKEGASEILLTDIAGAEDHFGDMDFKLAGTKNGVTAVQMDLKISGISLDLAKKALTQARDARLMILDKIEKVISQPKSSVSEYAPKIVAIKINPSKIGELIGPGGKNIKKITADTGATIDIDDDGTVQVGHTDAAALEKALEAVKGITAEAEIGRIYLAKVKRIMDFGAFCEIMPGKEGLVHVSELSNTFVKSVEDEVKIDDEFPVKVIEVDQQGRVNLSKKSAIGKNVGDVEEITEEEKKRHARKPSKGRRPRR